MNVVGIIFMLTAILSGVIGYALRHIVTRFKLRGATLFVELERATGDMKLDWRKPTRNWYTLKRRHGEADVPLVPEARLEASFIRKDMKDGQVAEKPGYNPWGNRNTGLRAFIIDAATGLPVVWDKPQPAETGGAYHLLDGFSLNKIRKDIRIKAIQANNGIDMAAIAKLLLVGVGLVLLTVLFIAWKMGGS